MTSSPKATSRLLYTRRVEWQTQVLTCCQIGGEIVYAGGKQGEHRIWADVSSAARILAHWEGYCQSNGLRSKPAVGEKLSFQRGMFGLWPAVVTAVHKSRVTLSYRLRRGEVKACTVSIADLRFT